MLWEIEELLFNIKEKPPITLAKAVKSKDDDSIFDEEVVECISSSTSIEGYTCNHEEEHSDIVPISLQLFVRAVLYLGEFAVNGGLLSLKMP